jgi:hypothetical protein
VSLEWDRGHESLIAILRAESPAGVVISEIRDLCELHGRRWICADEVLEIDDLEPDDPARRLAVLRGSLANHAGAEPTDLNALLGWLQDTAAPIAIYTSRTGSTECLVGAINRITPDHVVLAEIDTGGIGTGEALEFRLNDIIAIEWGTNYLDALAELSQSSTASEH